MAGETFLPVITGTETEGCGRRFGVNSESVALCRARWGGGANGRSLLHEIEI